MANTILPDADGVPPGWKLQSLGQIAERVTKGTTPTSHGHTFLETGVTFVKVENLASGQIDHASVRNFISDEVHKEQARSILQAGDVLFSIAGTIGRTAIVKDDDLPANTNQALAIIRGTGHSLLPAYLVTVLRSAIQQRAADAARGSGMNNISLADVKDFVIPIPSREEQEAIVQCVDAADDYHRSARDHVSAARNATERLRQAALAAAGSGRLTADWREEHEPEQPVLPVSVSKSPRQFRSIGSYDLDELPNEWRWFQVNDLLPVGGIFDGPFGSNLKSSDYTESGARVIRLENIGHLEFRDDKRLYVSPEKFGLLRKHAVYPGDIVFSSFVEERVRACVLPSDLDAVALAKADCFTIRPIDEVNRRYMALQLASPRSYRSLARDVHGATRPRVKTTQVRSLPIPLCSLAEQEEIVRRFERLTTLADAIHERVDFASRRLERSTHAVLAKAFRGELVTRVGKPDS